MIPYLRIGNLKNHTLSGGTYLYSPYMGVPPGMVTKETSQSHVNVVILYHPWFKFYFPLFQIDHTVYIIIPKAKENKILNQG